jgi:hypothetical protein
MKRIFLIAIALTVICSENGYARNNIGFASSYGDGSCSEYLDAYSRTTLEGPSTFIAGSKFHQYAGWILGYISAFNNWVENGKQDVLGNMTHNDTYKWLASWCRDRMSENCAGSLSGAVEALILKLDPSSRRKPVKSVFSKYDHLLVKCGPT